MLHVGGLHYASEKAVVERKLGGQPGVLAVEANPVAQTATVEFDHEQTSVKELQRWVEECGYHCTGRSVPGHVCDPLAQDEPLAPAHDHAAVERADHADGHGHGGHAGMSMAAMVRDMRNRFLVALVFAVPIAVWSPLGNSIFGGTPPTPFGMRQSLWQFFLSLPVVFYSSQVFFTGVYRALKAKTLDMMVLVAVAIGTGWIYSVAAAFWIGRRRLLRGLRLPRRLRPARPLVRDARPRRCQRCDPGLARSGAAEGGHHPRRPRAGASDRRGRRRRLAPDPSRLQGAG